MDERLKRILILYGEEADTGVRPDVDAAAEMATLRNTKALLDARPRRGPRPETLEAISAAARAATLPRAAADRGPVGRPSRRLFRSASYATTLALMFVAVWFVTSRTAPPTSLREPAAESGPADSGQIAVPPVTDAPYSGKPLAAAPEAGMAAQSRLTGAAELAAVSRPVEQANEESTAGRAPVREERQSMRTRSLTETDRQRTRSGYDLISAEARVDVSGASDSELSRDVSELDLSWDHSDEMLTLFERVERLSRLSPTEDQWRTVPARRTLAAPVGLAAPQYTSLQSGY